MFVAKGGDFLPEVSLRELQALFSDEKNPKAKIRLQCAFLRKKGKSQPFISGVTGLPVTTVSAILRRFEERGLAAAHALKQTGQPSKLSANRKKRLKDAISCSPERHGLPFVVWTTKLVQYYIHRSFKVFYSLRQVQNTMKGFGLSLQKPRPEHVKASKELQKRFKKNFDEELKNLCRQDMRSSFWTNQYSV